MPVHSRCNHHKASFKQCSRDESALHAKFDNGCIPYGGRPKRIRFIVVPSPVMFSGLKAFDAAALHYYPSLQLTVATVSQLGLLPYRPG